MTSCKFDLLSDASDICRYMFYEANNTCLVEENASCLSNAMHIIRHSIWTEYKITWVSVRLCVQHFLSYLPSTFRFPSPLSSPSLFTSLSPFSFFLPHFPSSFPSPSPSPFPSAFPFLYLSVPLSFLFPLSLPIFLSPLPYPSSLKNFSICSELNFLQNVYFEFFLV